MADFVLVYTVLRRDVACRMECSRLRAGDQFRRPFIGSASLYKAPVSSLQHAERRWAQFDTAIRRGKGIHISVWKKHLEILLHSWVIWKVTELPPLQRLILAAHGILATQFGVSPRVGVAKSRRRTGGGVAWFAFSRAFPQTQGISFLALSP